MEHKVWVKIFALLLLGLTAQALHDNETSPHSTAAPETPAAPALDLTPGPATAGPESGPSLDESSASNNNNTETGPSSSLNDTAEEAGATGTNSSEILNANGTIPEEATSLPASENQTFTTQSQQTTTSTTLSSTNKTETLIQPTSATHLEINNTSQPEAPVQTIAPTTQLSLSTRTSVSTPITTTISTSTASTTTSTASTTTSSTTATTTTTTTAAENTQAPAGKEKTTQVQSGAVTHKAIAPSQLNVGEETTVVHEGPTLDPLLAGLVSAFIIAAVIITLLLFLKLRRRDSRPEFRRLQDLPMDDMMEDTPLSMYSY